MYQDDYETARIKHFINDKVRNKHVTWTKAVRRKAEEEKFGVGEKLEKI
jgi:hypothetical protein